MSLIRAYSSKPAAVLQFTGEDHADFLQSQGTADLRGPEGYCRYDLWLDHKGLIQGDAFVLKISGEEMMLVSYGTSAATLIEKFNHHIIADDVEITDFTSQWDLLTVHPDSAGEFFSDRRFDRTTGSFLVEADGYVFPGRRLGPGCIDYLVPSNAGTPLEISELSASDADLIRVRAGIPAFPEDIQPGVFNPLEAALLSPISFDKGCYLGQEVVARVHRLGRLSRRFALFSGSGDAPVAPYDLMDDERPVGALTTVVKNHDGWLAIGWLKSRYADGPLTLGGLDMTVSPLASS